MSNTYAYKVRDRTGNVVTGQLVGDNETLVLQKLREMGLTPAAVKKAGGAPRPRLEGGPSLAAAMAKHPKAFNNLFISMVKAGETGGVLDDVLLNLADEIEKDVELKRQIKSAMTYPIVVVCLVVLIMTAMLLFVVPQFEAIYSSLGGELPLPTQLLMTASDIFKSYWYMMVLGLFAVRFLLKRYKKTEKGRARVDGLKIRVPVFGPLFHKVALARFSATLGLLLRAGVPILQALDNVKDTVNNKVISIAVEDAKNSGREGESIP